MTLFDREVYKLEKDAGPLHNAGYSYFWVAEYKDGAISSGATSNKEAAFHHRNVLKVRVFVWNVFQHRLVMIDGGKG